jgi:hypothetical protein
MEQPKATLWRWIIATGLMVLVAACGVTGALVLLAAPAGAPDPPRRLEEARRRWSDHAIGHYRLVIQPDEFCLLDVEVRDERVVSIFRKDRCAQPAGTVTELFNLIERGGVRGPICARPGCACQLTLTIYGIYDAQRGFPQRIIVRSDRNPNYLDGDYWRYAWQWGRLTICDGVSEVEMLSVLSLTPVQ